MGGSEIVIVGDRSEGLELQDLPARPAAFLEAYRLTGTLPAAADRIGCSRNAHYHWRDHVTGYQEAFEVVLREANDALEALLHERVQNGFREERFDADGNLLFYRIRHDAALLRMLLQARLPEKYGKEGAGGTNITVIIEDVAE